ncbi:hypothetical protein ACL02S_21980 [Nocardia sp. 004]|uniref:hypothetical protein n=1 Tax=Nocardia sp. 004 TaxID=3385978 RepID=UPI0039A19E29
MTAHRPNQFVRHAAIVLAGTASLSLTVAAGTYVVHQIADTQRPATRLAAPVVPLTPKETHYGPASVSYPAVTGGYPAVTGVKTSYPILAGKSTSYPIFTGNSSNTPAALPEQRDAEPKPAASHDVPTVTQERAANRQRELRLGDAYIRTQLAEGENDTVSITVDTNALAVLTGFLPAVPAPEQNGDPDDAAVVTTLRTDLNTQNGAVRMELSSPGVGERTLRLDQPGTTVPPAQSVDSAATNTKTETAPPNTGAESITI